MCEEALVSLLWVQCPTNPYETPGRQTKQGNQPILTHQGECKAAFPTAKRSVNQYEHMYKVVDDRLNLGKTSTLKKTKIGFQD